MHVARATVMCAGPGSYACEDGGPNGVCQQGEECDDGNTVNGDGCDSNCMKTGCGNGVSTSGEECDDGASNDDVSLDATPAGDPCDTDCRLKACANGRTEGGETCDDGNTFNNDGCDSDPATCVSSGGTGTCCRDDECVNGITNNNEECDDANTVDDDNCSNDCESNFCGDGVEQPGLGEECDDANTNNLDACNNDCTDSVCGDSEVDTGIGENCDDGDTVSNDGCSATCISEFCGDGISQTGEGCDDGNTVDDATCLGDCSKVPLCGDAVSDGAVEECDDGACICVAPKKAANGKSCATQARRDACAADGGACINSATLTPCAVVAGDGNVDDILDACRSDCTGPICGDSVTDSSEICDDGLVGPAPQDGDDTDTCPNGPMMIAMGMACQMLNTCGDGVPDTDAAPLSCDNGNGTNPKTCLKNALPCSLDSDCGTEGPCGNSDTKADACRTNCQPASCGDGVTDSSESCDDGDTITDPLCRGNCSLPSCGDGVVVPPETCDTAASTGPNGANQPCTDTCKNAVCGDSKVCSVSGCTSGPTGGTEECDDGNIMPSDDCDDCRSNVCGDGVTRTSGATPLEQCDDGNTLNQDGCSGSCCDEPGAAGMSLDALFAGQECTLDNLVLEIAALGGSNGGNAAVRRMPKAMGKRALRKAKLIQSLARSADLKARNGGNVRSRKRVKMTEKRVGRLLIHLQRMLDHAHQDGHISYTSYASVSAYRVHASGYVNQIVDTMFNTP
jgi:cysteine-rich repeat protein